MDVLIVALHSIEDNTMVRFENSTECFRNILQELSNRGYQSITLSDFFYGSKNMGSALPEKPVIITIDDGYSSIYGNAFPLAMEFNFKLTLFITLEYIADRNRVNMDVNLMPSRPMLLWDEILEMSNSGAVDIQSHGMRHGNYASFNEEDVLWNLSESKRIIEDRIQKSCMFLSWPNSNTDVRVFPHKESLGYHGFLRYSGGIEDTETIDWNAIKRLYIESIMPWDVVLERLFEKGKGDN